MDNVPVYFSQDSIQIKGGFAEDGRYYDKDSGALVTKTFKELLTILVVMISTVKTFILLIGTTLMPTDGHLKVLKILVVQTCTSS
ncbi:MAG: hypothetical protein ACLS5K_03435 [Streptococcus salivarius]